MVDYQEMAQLVEAMRVNVPSSIIESERTLQERDRILEAAEAEAAHILEQASRRAAEIVSRETMVQTARYEAERIIADAAAAARSRRDEADRYAARVLEELAEKLRIITKQVDNGLELLRQNMVLPADDNVPDAAQAPQQLRRNG